MGEVQVHRLVIKSIYSLYDEGWPAHDIADIVKKPKLVVDRVIKKRSEIEMQEISRASRNRIPSLDKMIAEARYSQYEMAEKLREEGIVSPKNAKGVSAYFCSRYSYHERTAWRRNRSRVPELDNMLEDALLTHREMAEELRKREIRGPRSTSGISLYLSFHYTDEEKSVLKQRRVAKRVIWKPVLDAMIVSGELTLKEMAHTMKGRGERPATRAGVSDYRKHRYHKVDGEWTRLPVYDCLGDSS
jgi:hypothetical protein